ncbi:ATP-binding protein [Streptomyces sp. NBC_00096]|uniref:ATP-binding protein n=1 Tax=Streptomyces sp. NBC_00096 TaxID=2975650 RepID=UPI00324EF061
MLTSTTPPAPIAGAAPRVTGAAPQPTGTASPTCGFARWAPDPGAAAVPLMRSRVRAVLDGWRVTAELADVLLLAVSELVGNVVLHAGPVGRMRVGVSLRGGWIQLDVTDGAARLPRLPHPRTEADPDAESGRGLLIVQLMTAEIGGQLSVIAEEFGKTVRVRVPAA